MTASSNHFRSSLRASVTIGALLLGACATAYAQIVPPAAPCNTVTGTTVTCTGNVSAGVSITSGTATALTVNSVTSNIAPASGVNGLLFNRGVAAVINSDLGTYSINTTGTGTGIRASGPSFSVTSTGAINSAGGYGIFGTNNAVSTNSISSTGNITSALGGLRAVSAAGYSTVSVTSRGNIQTTGGTSANADAIRASSMGGPITVNSTGTLTSAQAAGIFASGGRVNVTNDGAISAATAAINIGSQSFGLTSSGNLNSATSYGILASGSNAASNSLSNTGTITSVLGGIRATNLTGAYSAISVTNQGDIRTTGGNSGNADALRVTTLLGTITLNSTGVLASAAAGGIILNGGTINATNNGRISAVTEGIRAYSSAGVTLSSTGDITSTGSYGIFTRSNTISFNTVSNTGNITSQLGGIRSTNTRYGSVTVTNRGNIQTTGGTSSTADAIRLTVASGPAVVDSAGILQSNNAAGIFVDAGSTRGAAQVTNNGAITAATEGIRARGVTATVTTTGAITSNIAQGIYANGVAGAVSVTNTGAVTSQLMGIRALGTGFTVRSEGAVTSSQSYGILATGTTGATNTVSSTGDILSVLGGVRGTVTGSGAVTLTNRGNVRTTGGTVSNADALRATSGNGAVSVNSIGTLNSAYARGIYATTGTGTMSVISDGNISARSEGIRASGLRFIIGSTGSIATATSYGILATGTTNSLANSVSSTGDIQSVLGGIRATNSRAGAVTVTNRGAVRTTGGTASNADALRATAVNGAVSVNSIGILSSAYARGIYATAGTAAVSVTNNGNISARSEGVLASGSRFTVGSTGSITSTISYGILATGTTSSLANSVSSTGDIQSVLGGIRATNSGAGAVTITNRGNVRSTGGTASNADALRATAGNGIVTVDSAGALTSNNARGIYATAGTASVTVTNVGSITAQSDGLRASGSRFSVDSIGDITSATAYGINATANSGVLSQIVSTGAISADLNGIRASNAASGGITVTNRGSILTRTGSGRLGNGIDASSQGGAVSVQNTGSITSALGGGIYAKTSGAASATVTNDSAIRAQLDGIGLVSGSGASTITNSGVVTSLGGRGLYALGTGAMTVTNQAAIAAQLDGIVASSSGVVVVSNDADVLSAAARGIYGKVTGSSAVTVANSGSVFASLNGIGAVSIGGSVAIDSSSDVTSLGGMGIYAKAAADKAASVLQLGTVYSLGAGIYAFGSDVSVEQSGGDVVSLAGSGIMVSGTGLLSIDTSGTVLGAAGHSAVAFDAGTDNQLLVRPESIVANAGGIDQLAILGGTGNEDVVNTGTVIGSVKLGDGLNAFDNRQGALFVMGDTLQLGAQGQMTNAGTMSPGGNGRIETVNMTGSLQQTSDGIWSVDIDPTTGAADLISLSGAAELSGVVQVNVTNSAKSTREYTILHADGGVTHDGLMLGEDLPSTLALSYQLLYPDEYTVVLGVLVDFSIDNGGLNENQTNIGDNLSDIYENGSNGMSDVTDALAGLTDNDAYKDALNQLLPEPYLQAAMSGVTAASQFSDALVGCHDQDERSETLHTCLWFDAGGGYLQRDETEEYLGSRETVQRIGTGVETDIAPSLRIGVAARYERVNQDVYVNSQSDGDRAQVGASITYEPGDLLLAAAVSVGRGWLDTERSLAFNGFSGDASGDQDIGLLHGKLRAAYRFGLGKAYLKPGVDLEATEVSYGGVEESGGNGAALRVDSTTKTVLSASPSLEIGGEWNLNSDVALRPFLKAGATFYEDPTFTLSSAFEKAPAGTPHFTTREELDSVLASITAGVDLVGRDGSGVRLFYEGTFGETTQQQGGGITAQVSF